MANSVIAEGNKIDLKDILTQRQIENDETPNVYASQLLEFMKNGNLKVSMPFVQGRLVPLDKDKVFEAFFYTSKGLYQSKVKIIERYKSGNIYTMEVQMLSEPKKYQRRQYFRLEKEIQIKYTMLTEYDYKSIVEKRIFPEGLESPDIYSVGDTLDISGGGMRFIGRTKVDRNDRMLVIFEIVSDGKVVSFRLPAKIIMSFELPNHSNRFEHRIEFENISNAYREILIKYIFEEERKLRSRTR